MLIVLGEYEDGNNLDMVCGFSSLLTEIQRLNFMIDVFLAFFENEMKAASSASVAVRELAAIVFTKDELIISSVRRLKSHKDKQAKLSQPPRKLEELRS